MGGNCLHKGDEWHTAGGNPVSSPHERLKIGDLEFCGEQHHHDVAYYSISLFIMYSEIAGFAP